MRVWLTVLMVFAAAAVGAAAPVLVTSSGDEASHSARMPEETASPEPLITRQQLKVCLDSYGADAQPGNRLVGEPELDKLIALLGDGEGGMTAFGVDSAYAHAHSGELIGTSQPEFLFYADGPQASRAAQSSEIVVTHAANVVVAAPGGDASTVDPAVLEIIETCLADLVA